MHPCDPNNYTDTDVNMGVVINHCNAKQFERVGVTPLVVVDEPRAVYSRCTQSCVL